MNKETSYDRVGHYFGNYLAITFNFDTIGKPMSPQQLEEQRQGFIQGLKETISHIQKGEVAIAKGVNEKTIEDLLNLAKVKKWDDKQAREQLKTACVTVLYK